MLEGLAFLLLGDVSQGIRYFMPEEADDLFSYFDLIYVTGKSKKNKIGKSEFKNIPP